MLTAIRDIHFSIKRPHQKQSKKENKNCLHCQLELVDGDAALSPNSSEHQDRGLPGVQKQMKSLQHNHCRWAERTRQLREQKGQGWSPDSGGRLPGSCCVTSSKSQNLSRPQSPLWLKKGGGGVGWMYNRTFPEVL